MVSFFGGDPYYARCAERLARQCDSFDLAYDICEYKPATGETWVNICRKKVAFYAAKLREHDSAVMWLDVDAQIIGDPRRLLRSSADFGAFLRNFRYLVGFDAVQHARLFHPGYLFFGRSPRSLAFMETMEAIDRSADPAGTDDYVLQEALGRHGGQLGFEIFSPADIVFSNESQRRGEAVFQHGDSGNVRANVAVATQHGATILTPERQKRVLSATAEEMIRGRRRRSAVPFLARVLELDPDDAAATVKLLRLYDSLGWKKKIAELTAAAEANPKLAARVLRDRLDAACAEGRVEQAARLGDRLLTAGGEEERGFVESRRYRMSFDERARAQGTVEAERVRMWWWERPYPGNLGDMINPYLVEALTGAPPVYATKGPRMLAIGSIIKFARAGDDVWGSGCPAADQPIDPLARFRAVRGPLTREMVLKAGGACEPVYGDPAWFLPLVYPPGKVRKTHRLGLVRHFTHRAQPLALDDDVREIEVIRSGRAGIEAFLDEMFACEAIVSTSLHGVIIANAYGIPARLATISASDRQIHGDGMKFDDYFLSVGRTGIAPLDLAGLERIGGRLARECTDNPERPIDLAALLAAAPFEPRPEIVAAARPRSGPATAILQRLGLGPRRPEAASAAAPQRR